MLYASLIGPLLGIYYPLPTNDETTARLMIGSSKLSKLWCSIYSSEYVEECIKRYGGMKLPDSCAQNLDYDTDVIWDAGLQEHIL